MYEVTFVFKVYNSKNENKNMIECKGAFSTITKYQHPRCQQSIVTCEELDGASEPQRLEVQISVTFL